MLSAFQLFRVWRRRWHQKPNPHLPGYCAAVSTIRSWADPFQAAGKKVSRRLRSCIQLISA